MSLKKSLILTLILSVVGIAAWEIYWRSQGYKADLDDDKFLWAANRARVDKASTDDVVLMGSSRVLFDIQVHTWKKLTGKMPIQLANAGSSPLPVFHDIVEKSDFAGTILVGVTPGLFFSTTFPQASPWKRAATRTAFYHNQTYAQQLNYYLSLPLQNNLAFISNDDEGWSDDINLKALLKRIDLGKRTKGAPEPPFYRFQDIDKYRNVRMKERMVEDTAFAGTVKKVWQSFMSADIPPPDKEGTTAFFIKDLQKFKARGGKVILIRCPSTGFFDDLETKFLPRKDFWDPLVAKAKVPAYHYTDYPSLQGFQLPEWSHLSAKDADIFTERFVKILQADGHIQSTKTN